MTFEKGNAPACLPMPGPATSSEHPPLQERDIIIHISRSFLVSRVTVCSKWPATLCLPSATAHDGLLSSPVLPLPAGLTQEP